MKNVKNEEFCAICLRTITKNENVADVYAQRAP